MDPVKGDVYKNPAIRGALARVDVVTDDKVVLKMQGPGITPYDLSVPRSAWDAYIKGAIRVDPRT